MIKVPAKLILSGEHSVVYGAPALALPIKRFMQIEIENHTANKFFFDFVDFNCTTEFDFTYLTKIQWDIQKRYQDFLNHKCTITNVITTPQQLALYAVGFFIKELDICLNNKGLRIIIRSDIPVGRGLGSSAALITGLLNALLSFFSLSISDTKRFLLLKQVEDIQHGNSSGLDLHVVSSDKMLLFTQDKIVTRSLPNITFSLVDTGMPASTTGECVAAAKRYFKNTKLMEWGLLAEFSAVTLELDNALQQNDLKNAQYCIRENHKLLRTIGVVPEKAASFISELEKLGLAAKICGAGAISGDNAGVVLILGNVNINDIIEKYKYTPISSFLL